MKLYNSLKREKEEFVPLRKGTVGMYVCGPTVYDEPHIGHARSAYNFDVVRRYFAYRGYEVLFVRNVTDVDDKIINKARERVTGHGSREGDVSSLVDETIAVSKKYLGAYHRDMELLGIGRPDREPKATEYIPKMIAFIQLLIERGSAYASNGDVYFDITKAKDYGKLSNQNVEKMESGARVASGERKHDPLDFALWKSAKEGEPSWESPWGRGRPGWHIECSVMSSDILGDTFDIHGGGIDLIFPHHENEVAQSEGAGKAFARYWLHNGLLTINSEKMAKSLGNFITIQDFLAAYGDGDYLKLLFLSTHYRHPVDYTVEKIAEMKAQKERFVILFEKIDRIRDQGPGSRGQEKHKTKDERRTTNDEDMPDLAAFRSRFEEAMDDDLNTPAALAVLFDLVTHTNKLMHGKESFTEEALAAIEAARSLLVELTSVFGLRMTAAVSRAGDSLDDKSIARKVEERNAARKARDFARADAIRKELDSRGVILEDAKDGTVWRRKL